MKEWTGLYNKVRSKITDKSSALLVNWSPKQIYKTLHQPITSPIRSKAAILATSHEITILLSTTVGGGGEEKSIINKCWRPVLSLALKKSPPTGTVVENGCISAWVQAQWWFHQYYYLNKSIIFAITLS